MQPEVQLSFRRGVEELMLELCHDIATAEIVVNCHYLSGSNDRDRTDRFDDLDQATAYLQFVENRLLTEKWTRTQVRRWTRETSPAGAADEAGDESSGRPTAQLYRMNAAPSAQGETAPLIFSQRERSEATPPALPDVDSGKGAYALDHPLVCPHCREWVRTIKVVRMLRTQAPFTSTMPRSGRALACPSCDGILSLELSGFI